MIQESTSFFTSQSSLQKRFSVYNWYPVPRISTEDAIEKQIAGKWHLITLQEASHYVDHAILHERFYVTHFAGCAVLFNKDNLLLQRRCQVIHLPPRHQASLARSDCRRRTWLGFTRCCVTCFLSAITGERAEVLLQFNGTARRCRSRDNLSTIDEAFTDSTLPTLPDRPPLW